MKKGFTVPSPMMIQVELEGSGGNRLTTWVEETWDLDEGKRVYLKDTQKWYVVVKVHGLTVPKDQLGVRGFKNNI